MKTAPIGVRFEQVMLDVLKQEHGIDSPQKALNFLYNYWRMTKHKIDPMAGVLRAGEPVTVTIKAPEDPKKLENELNELVNLPHNKEKIIETIIENKGRKVTLTEKPVMPKGLSITEQIQWKIDNP